MEKLNMKTKDLALENITKLTKLFPEIITEVEKNGNIIKTINVDKLKYLVGDFTEDSAEVYELSWVGKHKSRQKIVMPINKTLRPVPEDSVDFENTENLYIEGDNFEVLKLLQESYLDKIKMIYIDPPYNTGKDFVYKDNFAMSREEYDEETGALDEEGNKLFKNTTTNGRFHSDWLSMIYERLMIARDFLRDDGVIFISIDDNEVTNLRKICDEVFGEENFVGQVTVLCNPKGRSQDKYLATCHEYLLIFSKSEIPKGALDVPKSIEDVKKEYPLKNDKGRYRELELRNTHRDFGKHNRPNLYYPFYITKDSTLSLNKVEGAIEIMPDWNDGFKGCWTWGKEKAYADIQDLVAKKVNGNYKVYRNAYAAASGEVAKKQLKSIWEEKRHHTEKGQTVFNNLFNVKEKLFQSPKSLDVLKDAISMTQDKNAIVLDFFSGSATTAHAVMQLNTEDGGSRKFIMVQLPEATAEDNEAFNAGYKTISEIGKERIRRAAKKIKDENKEKDLSNVDFGFKVFKIDSSNMKDVYYNPKEIDQRTLTNLRDNIKEDRTEEDLLFQVLLELALPISAKVREEKANNKTIYRVNDNFLIACFDDDLDLKTIKIIAEHDPLRIVFKDSSFKDDATKVNCDEYLKNKLPNTIVKVI